MLTTLIIATLPLIACNKKQPASTAQLTDTATALDAEPVQSAPTPDVVFEVVDNFKRVSFDTDSAKLTPAAKSELNRAAEILTEHPFVRVAAIGHADERGDLMHNAELGADRALAVESYLERKGVDPDRVHVGSAGESDPLVEGSTKVAWELNRRVEFRVTWDPFDEVDSSEDNPTFGGADTVIEVR